MKILLSWLRDYVDTGDDLDALADTLAMLGLPVEDVDPHRWRRRRRHGARRAHRAAPRRGQGAAGLGRRRRRRASATCGAARSTSRPATSCRWPPLGTTMPDGRTIARRGILGIDSEGMLCSARELGLGDDHSGHPRAARRTRRSACRTARRSGSRDDVVLDLDVTRNRPDCWSLRRRGPRPRRQARRAVHAARAAGAPTRRRAPSRSTTVEIVDGDRCGRFTSTVLSGVASVRRRRGWPSG